MHGRGDCWTRVTSKMLLVGDESKKSSEEEVLVVRFERSDRWMDVFRLWGAVRVKCYAIP